MNVRVAAISILLFSSLMSACGGGGGGSSSGTGTLQLGITDAPVDGAEAVVVFFNSITLHHDGGNTTLAVNDPVTKKPGYSIDLLKMQAGQWAGLVDQVIPAGHYSWIRLEVDLSKSYIQIAGNQYALSCTSCENTGYKLVTSFDVPQDAVLALMLDFDLRKSITDPANASGNYILRPTVRTVATAASGKLSGTVDSTLIANNGGINGCNVYVFEGQNAVLDDVYIPFNNALTIIQNNPVSTAVVNYDGKNYTYTAAFLPAGDYTAALTCDAELDSAATDDQLKFLVNDNVKILAGQTTVKNFIAPALP